MQSERSAVWPLLVLDEGLGNAFKNLKLSVFQMQVYSQAQAALSQFMNGVHNADVSNVVCVMGVPLAMKPGSWALDRSQYGFVADVMWMPSGKAGVLMYPQKDLSAQSTKDNLRCAMHKVLLEETLPPSPLPEELACDVRADVRKNSGQELAMPLEWAHTGVFYQGIPLALGHLPVPQSSGVKSWQALPSSGFKRYMILQLQSGHGVIFAFDNEPVAQSQEQFLLQQIAQSQGRPQGDQPLLGMQAKSVVLMRSAFKRFVVLPAITATQSFVALGSLQEWPAVSYHPYVSPLSLRTVPVQVSPWLGHGVRCVNAMPRISYIGQVVGCEPGGGYLQVSGGGFARYPYSSDLKAKVDGLRPDHVVKMTLGRDNRVDLLGGPYLAEKATDVGGS